MSSEPLAIHPQIRSLTLGDLDRVMTIEQSAYPFPWTRTIFADCIRVGYDCNGLFVNGRLVAYSVQTHAADECHLLNLCVAPSWQRRGYGGILLEHAIRLARTHRCVSMFLEVRPSNRAGMALYRRHGFRVIGSRRAYYRAEGGREDAAVMRLWLASGGTPAAARPAGHDPF